MEIISVKVGSPSQATKVSVEAPTQIKATFKDVIVNNGGGSVKSVNGQTGDVVLDAAAVGALPNTTKIPANTSDLTNNSGFITRTVSDLANYYLKSETYSKEELDNKISAIPKFSIEVVTSLPTLNISDTTVYLVASGDEEDNLYTEYIYVNGAWEYLGKQTVDLTGYVKRTELSSYYTKSEMEELLNAVENSIPTKLSQLTADSTHRTVTDAEKTAWNNKQPAGNYALQTELEQLSEEIADHSNNGSIHVTSAEKQVWNNKANKTDIPTIAQEAGESESLVMSQKAVTALVNEALGDPDAVEYETVDSVAEMTDTSKSYILKSTGTLWTYGEVTTEKVAENKFVPSTAILNQRLSGSSGSVSANSASIGSFVTDYIAVKDLDKTATYNTRLNWSLVRTDDNKVAFYNSSKTRLGHQIFNDASKYTISNGETIVDIKNVYNGSAPSNWADVAYVRLQVFVKSVGTSLTSADIANLSITFDADGGTITENKWYDTGITPSTSGGTENYVDMLVKVNQNKSDIAEVSERVTALETGSDSVTIPSFWQSAVDECVAKIKALQVGRNCVTFPFFSDHHQRGGYVGMLIAHIMKECGIPYAFFGGDAISNGYLTESTMIAEDKAFDTTMSYIPYGRFCRAVGNHDGFWNDNGTKGSYTRAQVYELFLREEGISQNKHFGEDGTYYYVDDIASKVRFIVLNTNPLTSVGAGSEIIDSTQLAWLQNKALSFDEDSWEVVIISHCPISNHYHANVTNAEEVISVVNASNVDVIGWFSGHIHRDRMYTHSAVGSADGVEGTNGTALGFTQVVITSDHTSIAYDDATKHTVANDDQSHAIDFVTINKATRTVNLTRLGIGNDRSYTY